MTACPKVLSLVNAQQPLQVQHADKLEHLLAYGMLMYWWGMVQPPRRVHWATALALLGLAMEGAQSLTAYRVMEWPDALANLAGVALGLGLLKTPAGRLLARVDRTFSNRGDYYHKTLKTYISSDTPHPHHKARETSNPNCTPSLPPLMRRRCFSSHAPLSVVL